MRKSIQVSALSMIIASGVGGFATPQQAKVTGAFENLMYENGNTYGVKIIIYQVYGATWVLFHDADAAAPLTASVKIQGNVIEFELPSDIDPSCPPRKFKGKIGNKFLTGNFLGSTTIKLKRCPL